MTSIITPGFTSKNLYSFKKKDDVPKDFSGSCQIGEGYNTYWYINGQLHREHGPAIEYANGNKKYYINNQLHRNNGPAIILMNSPHEAPYINDPHNCGTFHKNHDEYHSCNVPYLAWYSHGKLLKK